MSVFDNDLDNRQTEETAPEHPPARNGRAELPPVIARYRVIRILGKGGFGTVCLAQDDQLARPVAIKVPHPRHVSSPQDADAYLAEARVLASLDHAHIVPVYDVGRTEAGLCYVVSKFIEGSDLACRIKEGRPSFAESAALAASVADALHHAHKRGLVHRDVKPGNILIDVAGRPHVADFGLALRDEDFGKGQRFAGTPAYMSPEQARGEGHRVDGRSDLFSLGIVLYELLTGRRPFRGDNREEMLERIISTDPRPLRMIDDAIPRELERICLKALGKRAVERFTTAADMAEDLRLFLKEGGPSAASTTLWRPSPDPAITPPPSGTPASDRRPVRIVPKGLRSFDGGDADFFLELLPGPRDRDGLPEALRFWKSRIEMRYGERSFAVGVVYGPSGCGKSSFIKAGLLPLLPVDVVAVYVEAAAGETESRLRKAVGMRSVDLPPDGGLADTLAAIRRGRGIPAGKKLLLVIDQFEQWLHAERQEEDGELARALRQCDGARLQRLLLVRDDFWMAISRFMKALEIDIVEGRNAAAVDLFPQRHARKILTAFGRALEALPEGAEEPTLEQSAFLDQSVAGLAQGGKVSPVRLALFAEMVKDRPWTPATLQRVGGMEGVGVTFLEETFSAATARPEHRHHERAAQEVLRALLPVAGSDIKGHLRTRRELLQASGYTERPDHFDRLLGILDGELRLITPTEDASGEAGAAGSSAAESGRCYQLAHDYLVPSLREWLTRKQKETWRGRAKLRLAERAELWQHRHEHRNLPAWWEWMQILLLVNQRQWTPAQRKMMRAARWYHGSRGMFLASTMLILGWLGLKYKAHTFQQRLLDATTANVPAIVAEIAPYRPWTQPVLRDALAEAQRNGNRKQELHFSLALLPGDRDQLAYLYQRLLDANPEEFRVIRDSLSSHQEKLVEHLWSELGDPKKDPDRQFRAACALATYDPGDQRWELFASPVALKLVSEDAANLGAWVDALQRVAEPLLEPLIDMLEGDDCAPGQRPTIVSVFADLARGSEAAYRRLEERWEGRRKEVSSGAGRAKLARRQANLAAALVTMRHGDSIWPLLQHSPNPTFRTYLIDRLGPTGVKPRVLVDQWERERDDSVRRALLLALGEVSRERLPQSEKDLLEPWLLQVYRENPDAGIHAASEWILRHLGFRDAVVHVTRGLVTGREVAARGWYVNQARMTMVIVPPLPVTAGAAGWLASVWGPPPCRRLACAAKEVSVEEYLLSKPDRRDSRMEELAGDQPVTFISWYDAVRFCNWLSEQDHIPPEEWCYGPNLDGKYARGMTVKPDYLRLEGYRLPIEAEWEMASRAGASTTWFCGDVDEELFEKYACTRRNSHDVTSFTVGKLKPNDLGLFDILGNVAELCQKPFTPFDMHPNEMKWLQIFGPISVGRDEALIFRGGSFYDRPATITVTEPRVSTIAPDRSFINMGIRPVRTLR